MKAFWMDVLKIAIGTGLGGIAALFGFLILIALMQKFAPWLHMFID